MGGDGNSGFGRQGVDGGIATAPGATAPGVAQPMTLEGSGIPFLPAAEQPSNLFSPVQPNTLGGVSQNPNTLSPNQIYQMQQNNPANNF